jgi:hypothetical protein
MLIRPDACVAWASEENSTDGLEEALRRWFNSTLDDGCEPALTTSTIGVKTCPRRQSLRCENGRWHDGRWWDDAGRTNKQNSG